MIQISKAKDLATQGKKLITVYGEGGVGKTTFATMNPNTPKTLVISLEDDGGLVSVNNLPVQISDNIDALNVDYTGVSPAGGIVQTIQGITNLGYEVIIFDPYTNLRSKQASWLAGETQKVQPTLQQWGEIKAAMDMVIDHILALKRNANIIIIAHEERYTNNDSVSGNESFVIRPNLGKGVVDKFVQYSDEVIRITLSADGRLFDIGGTPNVVTKTRKYGTLPNEQKLILSTNESPLTIDKFLN